ncbi:ATP-dependent Clp protease ATP-binding subunit [Salipaludibacillus agaradhaerens]|jgi:ATP-dependent Clp protease ATP-binding subunit ClpA|uniref:AAA family ATPase n=1 Tax=Salipaludibacillus agaradhaerens TaxID=76935 RepID=UPI002151240E|nr:ATP-dependent Clp protease ATP-binding subunit [Salipaludibacillus agaradhaerens]MCR6108563.1 ATP-dependent Clp protease ATP-binding subunit [Salipaludibacillus agaradhaerens]MCR6120592.1 ATP-dependent Clp protease ATP-binding subunit [Salipaludibacillus agaradhaerens]
MENKRISKLEEQDTLRMASIHDFGKSDQDNNGGGTGVNSNTGGATVNVTQAPSSINNNQDQDDDDIDLLVNYNELAKKGEFSEALFRDSQIMQALRVLSSKKKPNALLTGDSGVGKTQIVEEIARRLVNDDPIVKGVLKGITIYELPLGKIVSGSSFVGQLEAKIYQVIDFAQNPKNKAIIFIDEIHQIMGSESNPTYNKLAQILKPALGRGHLRVIGATTTQEAVTFMSDPAFSRRWSEVQVPELSQEQTAEIVLNIRDAFQNHHNVTLPDDVIEQAVAIGDEFKQYGSHRPDSTITLIDQAMADARIKRIKLQEEAKTNPHLQHIITAQPKPAVTVNQLKQSALSLLTGDEKMFEENVDLLEDSLDKQIIGQQAAKTAVVDAVKRLGLRLTKRKRPVSFLFAGPSGTGKTEIAKQITEAVFGAKERMVYINMSEFSNPASMTRIIGSSAGYIGSDSKQELPFDTLENNPYQVVLLDEFEKAHTEVQRFFMQALDEGVVKTNRNKEIDFTRTIIIATTNAGVIDLTKRSVGFTQGEEPKRSNEDIIRILQSSFDTELLNRFEKLIAFTPIQREDYTKILAVKYNQLISEIQANRKDLLFAPDHIDIDAASQNDKLCELAEQSYTPASNGRPAERTIREYIENTLIDNPNNTQFDLL